ncbi:MAG: metallopeptidase family protein [Acidobacteria bacterium]|nr:metallopeptidase family protein [Acidobacteriota bacterium]
MQRREFEQIVHQAWRRIPGRFRRKVQNLAIVVEEEPGGAHLRRGSVGPGHTLLGLYEGVPLSRRGLGYGMVLPDKISLFQGPIEREARREEDIPDIVYETLWHELAHYFGMSESQVRTAERRRAGGRTSSLR